MGLLLFVENDRRRNIFKYYVIKVFFCSNFAYLSLLQIAAQLKVIFAVNIFQCDTKLSKIVSLIDGETVICRSWNQTHDLIGEEATMPTTTAL